MKRLTQIDLCKFVDTYVGLFRTLTAQNVWHIKEDGGIPGMISKSFCGDIGTIHSIRLASQRELHFINIAVRCADEPIGQTGIDGICTECLMILIARASVKVDKKGKEK